MAARVGLLGLLKFQAKGFREAEIAIVEKITMQQKLEVAAKNQMIAFKEFKAASKLSHVNQIN